VKQGAARHVPDSTLVELNMASKDPSIDSSICRVNGQHARMGILRSYIDMSALALPSALGLCITLAAP
jgi:hypothetical protein